MILGIDQGTTSTRAVLVDDELQIRASAQASHAQHTPHPGWVEHDAEELWANTQRVVAQVLAGGVRPTAVAIANQGETVMVWDARTGKPVGRAIVWSDTRTERLLPMYAEHEATIRDATGLRLDSYFSATKLRLLLGAEARDLAARGYLRAGTIDTWLIDRLTGRSIRDRRVDRRAHAAGGDPRLHVAPAAARRVRDPARDSRRHPRLRW